uniref:(northern house mosquito) hypothetical protein n=2 Tax=Culex pipiens TaxID=7175 RepID=A0A8D8NFP4_CULPI
MEEPMDYLPLPREFLEQVFHHLSVHQLKRARLVCRAWNETICGSKSLLDKFVFMVNHAGTCRKNCPDCAALANARERLLNLKLSFILLENWSLVKEHLQNLTLNCGYGFKVESLLNMLRNVSNLKSLTLSHVSMDDFKLQNVKLDFKMKHLKELSILNGRIPVKCLYVLKKVCVRLVILNIVDCFDWKCFSDHSDEQLFNLIFAVRDTLEHLGLTYRNIQGDLLENIASIDRLELKRLSLDKCDKLKEQHLISLSRLQPGLEYLEVRSLHFRDENILTEVCQNLANLTCFTLQTTQITNSSWLSYSPRLTHLELNSNCTELDFDEVTLPNLKILLLKWVTFPAGSLKKLFKKAPNLRELTFSFCTFQNAPELLESLPQLSNLQHLKLDQIHNFAVRYPNLLPHQTTNLRRLELIEVRPSFPLHLLCQRSPKLESLHLERINIVDRQLQLTCRALSHLKELSLQELTSVTGRFAEYVCTNRRSLEVIKVVWCRKIGVGERNRLNALRERIHVTC